MNDALPASSSTFYSPQPGGQAAGATGMIDAMLYRFAGKRLFGGILENRVRAIVRDPTSRRSKWESMRSTSYRAS
jgi:hypothetical protein